MRILRALSILLFIVAPAFGQGQNWGIATNGTLGVVMPDGSTITINAQGQISSTGGGGGAGGIATNSGTGIGNTFSNATLHGTSFNFGVSGLSTNENLGEVWASDFGFSPTNTAAGNSNALNLAILVCSNNGGGIIRYGGRGTNSNPGSQQTINLIGEHMFPALAGPRIRLQGDGATAISFTGSTTNGVLFGQFDLKDVILLGPDNTNSADVYPYTNLVGIYDGFFYDPQIDNCFIQGFGQGIALEQTGSNRGAHINNTHVAACDIAFALGDACDQTVFTGSDGRQALSSALDEACVVPVITNSTYWASIIGASFNHTNIIGSRYVTVIGGIWDYNNLATFTVGKGSLNVESAYAGTEHNYQVLFGHAPSVTAIIPYQNEGGGSSFISLDHFYCSENPVVTNIWVTPSAGIAAYLHIANSAIGGTSGFGVMGSVNDIYYDSASIGCTTNYSPFGQSFYYWPSAQYFHQQVNPTQRMDLYDEAFGTWSIPIVQTLFHGTTSDVGLDLWSLGIINGSQQDLARMGLWALGGSQWSLNLTNISFYAPSATLPTNNAANAYFAGSITVRTNASPSGVVSNFALVPGTYTNQSGAVVEAKVTIREYVQGISSASSSFLITNGGTGLPPLVVENNNVNGLVTNRIDTPVSFLLGTNDTFGFTTNNTVAATNGTGGNMTWVIVP